MPIERDSRDELAECLRLLVNGQMTNDDFDDHYYDRWEKCTDRAVQAIANFGYCLYSSDLPGPYKLKGWHAVSARVRETAERSDLFLQSNLDYEWPESSLSRIPGFCLSCGVILFVVSALLGTVGVFTKDFPWLFVSPLFVTVAALVATGFASSLRNKERYDRWCGFGDAEVWPFLRRSDYDRQRGTSEATELPRS